MAHYVIYVPGLTDKTWHIRYGQRAALQLWRLSGVQSRYFVADWANQTESYAHKLGRLKKQINTLHARGHKVSLVAVSAGSSLALNAFADDPAKIHALISICGMIKHPEAAEAVLFALNPAFKHSMLAAERSEAALMRTDRHKILIVRAARDRYVPNRHGSIAGAHVTTIPSMGHVFSIVMAITIYRGRIIQFIKNAL